jgi:hypothetical protein
MMRIVVLTASAAINASAIPTVGSKCASNKDIDASRTRWATARRQPANTADHEKVCRAYAASHATLYTRLVVTSPKSAQKRPQTSLRPFVVRTFSDVPGDHQR